MTSDQQVTARLLCSNCSLDGRDHPESTAAVWLSSSRAGLYVSAKLQMWAKHQQSAGNIFLKTAETMAESMLQNGHPVQLQGCSQY